LSGSIAEKVQLFYNSQNAYHSGKKIRRELTMNSDKIKSLLKDWRISIAVGVVIGILLGLLVGWGIWPVQWTDLAPYHLRSDLREDYLRMSIFTTAMTGDTDVATKAWSELGDTAEETLDAVRADADYLTPEQITSFVAIIGGAGGGQMEPTTADTTQPVESETGGGGPNWLLLGGFCVVLLVGAAIAIYFFVIRPRQMAQEDQPETLQSMGHRMPEEELEENYAEENIGYNRPSSQYAVQSEEDRHLPIGQFMTTYMMGDDLYDDSFSIDSPTGEFLGECGVGISDTVGVGDPKRVSAFEVWLFDKNDIQTVTKVVMSEHVYEDNNIRMRLESKGEPILAESGKVVLLETATLQLEARIVDMEYGEGAAPDQSYFQRLTLELAVWPKERGAF
jgi:hypothetical protein